MAAKPILFDLPDAERGAKATAPRALAIFAHLGFAATEAGPLRLDLGNGCRIEVTDADTMEAPTARSMRFDVGFFEDAGHEDADFRACLSLEEAIDYACHLAHEHGPQWAGGDPDAG